MNDLNFKKRDYLEAKGNADHYGEMRQEKQAEIAELEGDLAHAQDELKELQSRIATASREMAISRLSADQFMELKRESAEKENKVNLLSEAVAAEKEALAVINDSFHSNRKAQSHAFNQIAAHLRDPLVDDIAALAGDRLKDLIHTMVIVKGGSRAYSIDARQRDQNGFYQALGEMLCRRVFPNENGSLDFIPDLLQAQQYIGELIEQRD